jgi:RNA polymerase sigma-70 factor (ECF subfamily)
MALAPAARLRPLDELALSGVPARHPLPPAARADLLRRAHREEEAGIAYRRALDLCSNPVEREYLSRRLAEIEA